MLCYMCSVSVVERNERRSIGVVTDADQMGAVVAVTMTDLREADEKVK